MRWRWIDTPLGPLLRLDPLPPGVGELGFAGRWQPAEPILNGRATVRLGQVHGNRVLDVSEPGSIAECDGARTRAADLLLTVRTADCVPVLVADASQIALLHAGWRGLAAGILEAGLSGFGDPEAVRVVLGPAIRTCCYEVGPEVAARFPAVALRPGPRGRPYLDLYRAATVRLIAAGVPPSAIQDAPFCTRCHQHLLASARGSGGGPGRIIAFASHHPEARFQPP